MTRKHDTELRAAFLRALETPHGVAVHTNDVERAIARAYHVRKDDPRFAAFKISRSHKPGEFLILYKDKTRPEPEQEEPSDAPK